MLAKLRVYNISKIVIRSLLTNENQAVRIEDILLEYYLPSPVHSLIYHSEVHINAGDNVQQA